MSHKTTVKTTVNDYKALASALQHLGWAHSRDGDTITIPSLKAYNITCEINLANGAVVIDDTIQSRLLPLFQRYTRDLVVQKAIENGGSVVEEEVTGTQLRIRIAAYG